MPNEVQIVQKKYDLPNKYFISVGSIIERKNLLKICKALQMLDDKEVGLVVVGKGKDYKTQVISFLKKSNLEHRVYFLEDKFSAAKIHADLPILMHTAVALIYPSMMEGFGLPVVEAMAAQTAVITSNVSSLVEAGGDAALSVNPAEVGSIADSMSKLLLNATLRIDCIEKGKQHAQKFTVKEATHFVHHIYDSVKK